MTVNLDTPKPWTDAQLREFYNACSPSQQGYIDRLNRDKTGRDLADIMADDTTVPRSDRAAAHAYFAAVDTRNPYA